MSEGYKNLGFKVKDCISELIDNSFDQGATELQLWFFEEVYEGDNYVSFLFQDNGPGVSSALLDNFIKFKDDDSQREQDITKNGKFHWGLAASLGALSDYAEIFSHDCGTWYHTQYPYVRNEHNTPNEKNPFEVEQMKNKLNYQSVGIIFYIQRISKVILAEVFDLDQLDVKLANYISETYREDLLDKKIFLNGIELVLIDPLMMNNKSQFYNDFEVSKILGKIPIYFNDIKINLMEQDSHLVDAFSRRHISNNINFKTSIMDLTLVLVSVDNRTNITLPRHIKVNEENSGFYILRNRRQVGRAIKLTMIYPMHNRYNRVRAQLKFSPIYDELFGVQVNKSNIEIKSVIEKIINQKISELLDVSGRKTITSKMTEILKLHPQPIVNKFIENKKVDTALKIFNKSNEILHENKVNEDFEKAHFSKRSDEYFEYDYVYTEEDQYKIPELTDDEHRKNFNKRVKDIKACEFIHLFYSLEIKDIDHKVEHFLNIIKPKLEGEVFGLLQMIKILSPHSIPFEILDYNDRMGLDCIARHDNIKTVGLDECFYVELKKDLKKTMNHRLTLAKYILCWSMHEHFKMKVRVMTALDGKYDLKSDESGYFVINQVDHVVRIIELEKKYIELLKGPFVPGFR